MIWISAYQTGNHPPMDFGPYEALGIEQNDIYVLDSEEVVLHLSNIFDGWVDNAGNRYHVIEVRTGLPKKSEVE